MKRKTTEWDRIHASYTSDRYKELKPKLPPQLPNNKGPFKRWAIDLNRVLLKEEIKMAKKTSKNVCHLLLLGKCKSNNFEISSYTSQNGKDQLNKCWRGYSERGTFIYCWWDCKMNSNSRDQCGEF